MNFNLPENIKKLRKERNLTQEQLADAMSVSIAAVSKWESGQSVPEVAVIMELADFFETSVDVLLGYEWRVNSVAKTVERIKALRQSKSFSEGTAEAEKALQKFPNCFDVVYNSALTYFLCGIEDKSTKAFRRALELYQKSAELIDQCNDKKIGEITIKRRISTIYLVLGKTEQALNELKNSNCDGCNNSLIGSTLADDCKKPEEALPYLSDSLTDTLTTLLRDTLSYSNAYIQQRKYRDALDILNWMRTVMAGLKPDDGTATFLDKSEVMILTGCAEVSVYLNKIDDARKYLTEAMELAIHFDASPDYRIATLKYYHGPGFSTSYDSFGATALTGLTNALAVETGASSVLLEIWKEIYDDRQL